MRDPLSILIVDDDPAIRGVFSQKLNNHDVVALSGVLEVRQWLEAGGQPDIVLTDQAMPGGTGLAVLRLSAQHVPNAFRLLVTGTPEAVDHETHELADRIFAKAGEALDSFLRDLNDEYRHGWMLGLIGGPRPTLPSSDNTPNWWAEIREHAEDEHPISREIRRRLAEGPLGRMTARMVEASKRFAARAPTDLAGPLRQLERANEERRFFSNVVAFNVGVDHGIQMKIVATGLNESGAPVDRLDRKALFRLSYQVGLIAKRAVRALGRVT